MKIYKINEGEMRKIVSVDKISLVQTGDKIDDIILADGSSVLEEYLSDENCAYEVILHYGNYQNKQALIAEVIFNRKIFLVSSVKGDVIKDENGNYFLYPIFTDNLLYNIFIRDGHNKLMTVIDYGGNFILNDRWYTDVSWFSENMLLLIYDNDMWLFDIEKEKIITKSSFKDIRLCPDNKHAIVEREYNENNVIDFEGNFMFKDWYNNINADVMKYIDGQNVFYYITYDTTTKLWNEDFKEVMDFDNDNINFMVSDKSYNKSIILMKPSKNGKVIFNILDRDFSLMFESWVDDINYSLFGTPSLFVVESNDKYLIMDSRTIKPWGKCKDWVEDIVKLDSISLKKEWWFAVKENDGNCFTIKFARYGWNSEVKFDRMYDCKDIKEDDYENVYLICDDGNKILRKFYDSEDSEERVERLTGDLLIYICNNSYEFIVRKNEKYNFYRDGIRGSEPYYKEGEWLDNVYCIEDRFIIIERNGKYSYFDTNKWTGMGHWYDDVEPAEMVNGHWTFRVMDGGEWIDL